MSCMYLLYSWKTRVLVSFVTGPVTPLVQLIILSFVGFVFFFNVSFSNLALPAGMDGWIYKYCIVMYFTVLYILYIYTYV